MNRKTPSLDDLRREIDRIDADMLALLARRVEIARTIGQVKATGDGINFRPAREAQVLRRLVSEYSGPFAKRSLVRIWREMFGSIVALQGAFEVIVLHEPEEPRYWELARDQFGTQVAMQAAGSAAQVLHAVSESRARVGVLPVAEDGEAHPWWPQLLTRDAGAPRIIARLPFAGGGNGLARSTSAYVVGRQSFEPSGDDRTLIACEVARDISRASLGSRLRAIGGPGSLVGFAPEEPAAETRWCLYEAQSFIPPGDPRLEPRGGPVRQALHVGAFATPFSAQALR